jgi:nitrogen fixation NifU-like protein
MDFADLYQEIILDHYRKPRNAAVLDHIPDTMAHENPACGDSLKLEVVVDASGIVERVRFDGKGCAISTASASIMTEQVRGRSVEQARGLAEKFIHTLRGEKPAETLDSLDELVAFKGVISFPVRVKCATLAWHALLVSLAEGSGASGVTPRDPRGGLA